MATHLVIGAFALAARRFGDYHRREAIVKEDGEMIIQRIHHVQVTVPRESASTARDFYCGILGLPEIEKPDSLKARGGFWVSVGDRELHVSVEDGVERTATKAHVAYQVDDLEAWRRRLASAGVLMVESVPIPGYDRFECRDPFGNRMEFIAEKRP